MRMKNIEEKQKRNVILEYMRVIVVTLLITYIVLYFIQISKIQGSSMEPTYHQGNVVIVEKIFYKMGKPSYNDIIVVDSHIENKNYIKRVVGLGGDHLEIKDGTLYRNGNLVQEKFLTQPMVDSDMVVDIPKGKIFVMGDNRNNSSDSRQLGYFDAKKDIIGKVVLKLF